MKESAGIMSQPEKKLSQRLFPIGVNIFSFAIFAAVAIILRASVEPVRFFVLSLSYLNQGLPGIQIVTPLLYKYSVNQT